MSFLKSAAKVQQKLHICKRSGYFFWKKSDLSPICKYWVAIGSLLTDSYSVLTNARTIVRILKKITRLCICTAGCERNFGGNPCTGGPKYNFFFIYASILPPPPILDFTSKTGISYLILRKNQPKIIAYFPQNEYLCIPNWKKGMKRAWKRAWKWNFVERRMSTNRK